MFASLIDTLEERGRGIHAYRAVAEAGFAKAKSEPDRAAGHYLLARLAEDFVEVNERMPLPASVIDGMFQRLAGAARDLDQAYAAGDSTAILAVLNRVAAQAAEDRHG